MARPEQGPPRGFRLPDGTRGGQPMNVALDAMQNLWWIGSFASISQSPPPSCCC